MKIAESNTTTVLHVPGLGAFLQGVVSKSKPKQVRAKKTEGA